MQKGLHFLGDLNCRENPLERFERLERFEQFSEKSLERATGVEPATSSLGIAQQPDNTKVYCAKQNIFDGYIMKVHPAPLVELRRTQSVLMGFWLGRDDREKERGSAVGTAV